jgi:hypothetical protein
MTWAVRDALRFAFPPHGGEGPCFIGSWPTFYFIVVRCQCHHLPATNNNTQQLCSNPNKNSLDKNNRVSLIAAARPCVFSRLPHRAHALKGERHGTIGHPFSPPLFFVSLSLCPRRILCARRKHYRKCRLIRLMHNRVSEGFFFSFLRKDANEPARGNRARKTHEEQEEQTARKKRLFLSIHRRRGMLARALCHGDSNQITL